MSEEDDKKYGDYFVNQEKYTDKEIADILPEIRYTYRHSQKWHAPKGTRSALDMLQRRADQYNLPIQIKDTKNQTYLGGAAIAAFFFFSWMKK